MQNELLATFEDQVAELKGRLPKLTGASRRHALAQIESLTEFLELIDLIGGGQKRAANSETAGIPRA